MRWLLAVIICLTAVATGAQVIYIPPQGQSIVSITCSPCSFTGGTDASNIGVTVNLSPASPAFNGTLTMPSGTQAGSGNDANSFNVVGGQVKSHAAGGTIQPGQYGITVRAASGATTYTNSPVSQTFTVQATGPGGAGWQLAFSDEFGTAKGPSGAYMLNWQNQQTPTSITWGTSGSFCAAGCGQVVLPSPSGWSPNLRAGNTISLVGATNTGSGTINTNFQVYSVTDDQHFLIYMPGTSAVWGTIGVSGATIGTAPWVASIVNSTASPQTNPTMAYTNNYSEGWAPENLSVGASGMQITTQNTAYTSADGVSHTYKSGHIQTWNGNAGFAQSLGNGWAIDFDGQPLASGTPTGIWNTFWALGNDNSWPGSSGTGGENDIAEFGAHQCDFTKYDVANFGGGALNGGFALSSTGTFIGTNHQFTSQVTSAGAISYYLDGSSIFSYTGWQPTDAFFPIIDVEYASSCGASATLPATTLAVYARVFTKVTSGACYSSIPSSGTIPHTGTC
jgi:hypothetical protein